MKIVFVILQFVFAIAMCVFYTKSLLAYKNHSNQSLEDYLNGIDKGNTYYLFGVGCFFASEIFYLLGALVS